MALHQKKLWLSARQEPGCDHTAPRFESKQGLCEITVGADEGDKVNRLYRTQEGVAVKGSDGRLRYSETKYRRSYSMLSVTH